jgi:hypothetical protein
MSHPQDEDLINRQGAVNRQTYVIQPYGKDDKVQAAKMSPAKQDTAE